MSFPLQPLPTLSEISETRAGAEAAVEHAERSGEGPARLRVLRYDSRWAAATEGQIRDGSASHAVDGIISAIRIGEGRWSSPPGRFSRRSEWL